ncbi:MAG: hypothetical protein IIC76_09560 [Bacteroidetes bacterium]|nr:hypothetical protein [Bacteroidota bacterium]
MREILKDKSFRLSIILTLVFLVTGFTLLHYELVEYGWAFFVLLPIVTGLSVGALPNKWWSIFGLIVGLVFTLVGLVTLGLEGAMCGLMSLGLLLPFVFLGALISHLI